MRVPASCRVPKVVVQAEGSVGDVKQWCKFVSRPPRETNMRSKLRNVLLHFRIGEVLVSMVGAAGWLRVSSKGNFGIMLAPWTHLDHLELDTSLVQERDSSSTTCSAGTSSGHTSEGETSPRLRWHLEGPTQYGEGSGARAQKDVKVA